MLKFKNLLILIVLIIVWSLFFAIYKYFVWSIFKTDVITLQYLSGYMSIGAVGAYLIGGFLYEVLKEKKMHFLSAFLSIVLLGLLYIYQSHIGFLTLFAGFFYGLWIVLRNILIATEITQSGKTDTFVNGICNIFFICSVIIGSILGGKIAENMSIQGVIVLELLLVVGLFLGFLFSYKHTDDTTDLSQRIRSYKDNYLVDFRYVVSRYSVIMIFAALIITFATIMGQKAIEYNVEVLGKNPSDAAVILLYSAIGGIVGNIISMKIKSKRWSFFFIFCILFAGVSFLFPLFISSFLITSILAVCAGLFFGVSFNLIESYFLKKISDDNKKSFGAATNGVINSVVIAGIMFLVDFIEKYTNFMGVYIFMGIVILFIGGVIYSVKNTLIID